MKKRLQQKKGPAINHLERQPVFWHVAGIIVLSFVVYSNALSGGFVWDDEVQVVKNPIIRDFGNLPGAFSSSFWSFAFSDASRTNYYRPLQTVAYMMAYFLGGLQPLSFHIISVAFLAGASVFLYLFCLELSFSRSKSLLVAALFAVHPIHTEAVAWIAGMPDVGCGFFYIASMWTFVRYRRTRVRGWLFGSAVLFLAALFCKEMALMLPAVLVLIGTFALPDSSKVKETLSQVWIHVAVLAFYLMLRLGALGALAVSHQGNIVSLLDWVSLFPGVLVRYFWYALVPYPLIAYHLIPIHWQDRIVETALASIIIAAATVVLMRTWRRTKEECLWLTVFVVSLAPVFYFKGISTTTFFAERYLYIPSLAIVILFVGICNKLYPASLRPLWLVVAAYGALTLARNPVWHDSETLYVRTLVRQPEVVQFRNNLGDIYLKKGDDRRAKDYLESALKYAGESTFLHPADVSYSTYVGLGAISARAGDYPSARKYLEQAIALNPAGDGAFLYLGGVALQGESNYPEALRLFQKAIDLSPVNEVARDYMGIAYLNQGNYKDAIKWFEESLRVNPAYKDARQHLDLARKAMGQ